MFRPIIERCERFVNRETKTKPVRSSVYAGMPVNEILRRLAELGLCFQESSLVCQQQQRVAPVQARAAVGDEKFISAHDQNDQNASM